MEGVILGAGNPLLDISADCTQEFADKYGLKMDNAILAEDKHKPIYGEMEKAFKVEYIAGGATQNSIRVAQWLLPAGSTSYTGCIADDDYGKKLAKAAGDAGVNAHYMITDQDKTGTCAVVVVGHERSLVADVAAANHFKPFHLETPDMKALVDKAKIFYVSSFFVTASQESVQAIAKHAAENNKIFTMNLAAIFLMEVPPFLAGVNENMPYCDYIFGNEGEAAAFGKSQGWETTDIKEIALKTHALPKKNTNRKRVVVFTQGPEPCIVCEDGKVTEYPTPPVPEKEILDFNGAGDAFVGGFLAQLALGKDTAECVRCGHYAASVVIRQSGCKLPGPHQFK